MHSKMVLQLKNSIRKNRQKRKIHFEKERENRKHEIMCFGFPLTARNLTKNVIDVPKATITMYGVNVIKNIITDDTDPMLADEKKFDII